MTVRYDDLDLQFDISAADASGVGPQPPDPQGRQRLFEALRPLVRELLEEELDRRMRRRGTR